MSSEKHTERFSIDTYTTKSKADEMLPVYAALLANNSLAGRFGVSVKPDPIRDKTGAVKRITFDIVLTDRQPDAPLPKFLRQGNFRFKPAPTGAEQPHEIEPEMEEEEAEESTDFGRAPKNALYKVGGELKTLPEWADAVGIKYQTLMSRLRKGSSLQDALTRPVQRRKN